MEASQNSPIKEPLKSFRSIKKVRNSFKNGEFISINNLEQLSNRTEAAPEDIEETYYLKRSDSMNKKNQKSKNNDKEKLTKRRNPIILEEDFEFNSNIHSLKKSRDNTTNGIFNLIKDYDLFKIRIILLF